MLRRASVTGWDELLKPWIEAVTPKPAPRTRFATSVAMIKHILEHVNEPLRGRGHRCGGRPSPQLRAQPLHLGDERQLHRFVVRMRLIRARSLLFEGNLSIENVAYSSGFTALSQFYEQFRNAYGITPREMRANYLHQAH